jgi:hypothetical protein
LSTAPDHPRPRRRPLAWVLAPGRVLAVGLALALAGCGGSAAAVQASTQKACRQVGAVLADGPDPDTDPSGYAEAQILPLRQIHPANTRLKAAVSHLDAAYQQLFASNGKSTTATAAVAAATKKVDVICPGAAS